MGGSATIVQLIRSGKYEQALGVKVGASAMQVCRAHIRMTHQYSGNPFVREQLNLAKSFLLEERLPQKARRLFHIGASDEALRVLQQQLEQEPSAHSHHQMGAALLQMERCVEALPFMEAAFALSTSPFHAIWLGQTLERLGRPDDALLLYEQVIEQRGEVVEYRLAGNIHFHAGRWEEAGVCYRHVLGPGGRDDEVHDRLRRIRQRIFMRRIKEWVVRRLAFLTDRRPRAASG